MEIKELMKEAHALSKANGHWKTKRYVNEFSSLVKGNMDKAFKEYEEKKLYDYEKGRKPLGMFAEFARGVINIMDFMESTGVDFEHLIQTQLLHNSTKRKK